jgi:hypothetical protein
MFRFPIRSCRTPQPIPANNQDNRNDSLNDLAAGHGFLASSMASAMQYATLAYRKLLASARGDEFPNATPAAELTSACIAFAAK